MVVGLSLQVLQLYLVLCLRLTWIGFGPVCLLVAGGLFWAIWFLCFVFPAGVLCGVNFDLEFVSAYLWISWPEVTMWGWLFGFRLCCGCVVCLFIVHFVRWLFWCIDFD